MFLSCNKKINGKKRKEKQLIQNEGLASIATEKVCGKKTKRILQSIQYDFYLSDGNHFGFSLGYKRKKD